MAYYIGEIVKLREAFMENHQKGDYSKAVMLGRQIVELYEENDDCHSMEYATDLNNLAIAYDDVCLYDKATNHYKEAAKLKKTLSGESISYADTLNNLAILYSKTKKYQEAVKMQQQVIQIRDRLLGRNHADYIMGLYNLGNFYEDMNLLEKALETQHKALVKAQRQNALAKLDYADILNSLGSIYQKSGNYKKSLESYRKAIEIIERSSGTDNFYYMETLLSASDVAEKSSLFNKATQYRSKAVTIRGRIMNKNHLDYIAALNSLSSLYSKAKDYKKALIVHDEALDILKKIMGDKHSFFADTISNMALDYCGLGDFDKAINKANEALAIKKEAVGTEHPQYAQSLISLGTVYSLANCPQEALKCYEQALEIRQNTDGLEAEVYMAMGKVYICMEDDKTAEQMYQKALDIRRKLNTLDDPGYIWVLQALGALLAKDESNELAMAFLWEACQLQKENHGHQHPLYARALVHLARGYMALNRYDDGAAAYEDAADLEEKMLGDDNPRYLKTLYDLADARYKNGEYEKAISCYKKHNDTNFEDTPEQLFLSAKEEMRISNCYMHLNQTEKAQAYYKRAFDKFQSSTLEPDDEWENLLSEKDNVTLSISNKQKSEQLIKKSKQVYIENEKQNRDDFVQEVQDMPKCSEDKVKYFHDAAELLLKIYNLRITEGGNDDREALRAALAMGDVYRLAEDLDQAYFWYQKAEKNGSGDVYAESCLKQARLYLEAKKPQLAQEKLALAKNELENENLTEDSLYVQVMGLLGDMYFDDKRFQDAIFAYTKWAERFKRFEGDAYEYNANRLLVLGQLLMDDNYQNEALEYFSEAALIIREEEGESPRFAKLLLKTAKMHISLGQADKGIVLLERAAVLYEGKKDTKLPLYGKILEMLGNQYYAMGRHEQAISTLEKAYTIFSDLPDGPVFLHKSRRNLLSLYRDSNDNKKYWLVKLNKRL